MDRPYRATASRFRIEFRWVCAGSGDCIAADPDGRSRWIAPTVPRPRDFALNFGGFALDLGCHIAADPDGRSRWIVPTVPRPRDFALNFGGFTLDLGCHIAPDPDGRTRWFAPTGRGRTRWIGPYRATALGFRGDFVGFAPDPGTALRLVQAGDHGRSPLRVVCELGGRLPGRDCASPSHQPYQHTQHRQ